MRPRRKAPLVFLLSALWGCDPYTAPRRDTGLDDLALTALAPTVWLAKTTVHVAGRSFVDADLGASTLVIRKRADGAELRTPLTYVSPSEMTFDVAALGLTAGTTYDADVRLEVVSTVDKRPYGSQPLATAIAYAAALEPTLTEVGDGVIFVNQPIAVRGSGFYLPGEGTTSAVLSGCFRKSPTDLCGLPVTRTLPVVATSRTEGTFVYDPVISGIGSGEWTGTLHLENTPAGTAATSADLSVDFAIQPPALTSVSTTAASLGQYVVLSGGGFVGGSADAATTLRLTGTFTPDGKGAPRAVDVEIVPELRSGLELRYVLDETDELGKLIDLRTESGELAVDVTLIVESGTEKVTASPVTVALAIAPLRQVVYLRFLDEWVHALRRFGLRAADSLIRQRILAVAARDYAGVSIEFRLTPPDDFAVFSQVDLSGLYPAGDHSFGYDNTPGKDVGNVRLYDLIGGVNAVTQQTSHDPGYGGVFLESFFLFSTHPPADIAGAVKDDPTWELTRHAAFDAIFDPFRADRGGQELTASELAALAPPTLDATVGCPAEKGDRGSEVACAVVVLGNLVGSTMTHEVGHSLGLASGDTIHNPGDCPGRLMDGGGDRPFDERSGLGAEPARFCLDDYAYLRQILPGLPSVSPPDVERPICTRCN